MKENTKIVIIGVIGLLIFEELDRLYGLVYFPMREDMVSFQFDMLTVTTVLIGFSFTVMGTLFGFSSNELIKKLENTDYMEKNINALMNSIIFFILSMIISFVFIFNLNTTVVNRTLNMVLKSGINIDRQMFICNIFLLMIGFVYFIKELRELSMLLKFIYKSKKQTLKKEKQKFEDSLIELKNKDKKELL